MRVIIAGGRDFNNVQLMMDFLNQMILEGFIPEVFTLICGCAEGADSLALELCKANNIPYELYPADWDDMNEPCVVKYTRWGKPYNALAGMKRNETMGATADKLIAFHNGSRGTANMIHYMHCAGKPVKTCPY
jgi:hypothetical protein